MADQRPALNNAFGTVGNFISLIIIYFLTYTTKGNLVIMGFVLSATPFTILLIASIVLFKGKYKHLKPNLHNIKWKHAGSLFGLGVKFFTIQIAALITYSTSNIIIAQLLGSEQVTVYNVAFKYFQIPIMLFGIIMLPIWSAVTDAFAREDFVWLKETLTKLNKISCLFFIVIIFMLIVSPFIYNFWIGGRVHIPFIVSVSMTFYAAITIFIYPYSSYINGLGKLHIIYRLIIITSLLYIPFAIILVKTPLQVAGVMMATCILSVITFPVYVIQTNKIIKGHAQGIWGK
jgi:O-antigen/teichoic acid export membrane protein